MEVGAELEKRDADLHKCTDKAPVASSMRLVAFIGMIVSRVPQGTLGEPLEVIRPEAPHLDFSALCFAKLAHCRGIVLKVEKSLP